MPCRVLSVDVERLGGVAPVLDIPVGRGVGQQQSVTRPDVGSPELDVPPEVVVIDLDDQPRNGEIDGTAASGGRILIGSHRVPIGRTNDLFLEKPFRPAVLLSVVRDLLHGTAGTRTE